MHTTGADLPDDHLSPTERREAVASILAVGLLRLRARPGWCAFPDDNAHSPVVKKVVESIDKTT